MNIDHYKFGKMEIDSTQYTDDLIISDDEIIEDNWWREGGGHLLQKKHLDKIVNYDQKGKLIIGNGHSGRMTVPSDIVKYLEENGFEVTVKDTTNAVKVYNSSEEPKIGAFHLTC